MSEANPNVASAAIGLPRSRRALPEPALGGAVATWQAILRVRHPEFTALIVEVIDDNASGTAGPAHRVPDGSRPLAKAAFVAWMPPGG